VTRTVVVTLWSGAHVVRRLRFAEADQPARVDTMSDGQVTANLRRLEVAVPATAAERRARLAEWPTQADLDAIATAWTASNDGVRPVVRVLEQATIGRSTGVGLDADAAGSVPR
jgi:hypothetical protein